MINCGDIYKIFSECFPKLDMGEKNFAELLDIENADIIKEYADGKNVGFAVMRDGHILLMCVLPDHRRKGHGSALLEKCENAAAEKGYHEVILGDDNWFFLGAVLSESEYEKGSSDFFSKRRYSFSGGCMEMSLNADNFVKELIPDASAADEFRFIRADERDMLLSAVAQVDSEWCQYFNEYENVFAAFSGGKIVSFCIAESGCLTMLSRDGENVGSVGCVGTIPAARGQGTGLAMVGKASEQLISRGCDVIYIHYTHLGKWYGKLGFEPFIYFGFGRKIL